MLKTFKKQILLFTPTITAIGMLFTIVAMRVLHISYFAVLLGALVSAGVAISIKAYPYIHGYADSAPHHRALHTVCILLLCCTLGSACAAVSMYKIDRQKFNTRNIERIELIEARATQDIQIYRSTSRIPLSLMRIKRAQTWTSAHGTILCFWGGVADITKGDVIVAATTLSHADQTTIRCAINDILKIKTRQTDEVARGIRAIRKKIRNGVKMVFMKYPKNSANLLIALFLGERAQLHPLHVTSFRAAGAIHILALSGMHIAIIVSFCYMLLYPFCPIQITRIAIIVLVLFYVWLIGVKPSLERAAIMIILWQLAHLTNRPMRSINILSYSFILFLLWRPTVWNDLSFQLSYSALAGIIALAPIIIRRIQSYVPKYIAQALGSSVGAQIATSPILIAHFGVLYPVGIWSSMVVTPLIVCFMWFSLGSLPLLLFNIPFIHRLIDVFSLAQYHIIIRLIQLFARLPALSF